MSVDIASPLLGSEQRVPDPPLFKRLVKKHGHPSEGAVFLMAWVNDIFNECAHPNVPARYRRRSTRKPVSSGPAAIHVPAERVLPEPKAIES